MKKQSPLKEILASPRLTCRDLAVLSTIGKLRVATPRLLAEVFLPMYPEASRLVIIRRRLRVLMELGLTDRWRPRLGPGEGTAEFVVFITEVGKNFLQEHGQNCRVVRISDEAGGWERVRHTYEVAVFGYGSLIRAIHSPAHIEEGTPTRLVDQRFDLDDVLVEHTLAVTEVDLPGTDLPLVMPDLSCKLFHKGMDNGLHLCIEWDRHTMTHAQLRRKALRYEAFCQRVGRAPVVGFVARTWGRVRSVARMLHDLHLRVQWFLTTAEDYARLPLGRIWLRPGDDDAVSLPL